MTEPGSVPPLPPASPFNPEAPRARSGPGCSKPLLIGCGIVGFILGACLVALFYFVGRNPAGVMNWSLQKMEQGLMAQLPKDLPAADRERLEAAFAAVRQKVESGEVSAEELQPINFKILEISRRGNLTREDVLELTEALEKAAAGKAPPG